MTTLNQSSQTDTSVVGLMLVKRHSSRLPNKNILPIKGKPMWQINAEKMLKIFDKVYISTDDYDIFKQAWMMGCESIQRPKELCGDTPNIPVYKHALEKMGAIGAIVAVQANSPTIDPKIIEEAKNLIKDGCQEVMTIDEIGNIYGSVWGLSVDKLKDYGDPYKPLPEVTILDKSIDIHCKEEYDMVVKQYE